MVLIFVFRTPALPKYTLTKELEAKFPVILQDFIDNTNVLDLYLKKYKEVYGYAYKLKFKLDEEKIKNGTYVRFYVHPKWRKTPPINELCVKDDCAKKLRKAILKIPVNYRELRKLCGADKPSLYFL